MTREIFKKLKIPDAPGVYFFLSKQKEILYIGKATSLVNRLHSYFDTALAEKRSTLIEKMVQEAASISWTQTESVLEAIILEVNLIRVHKPPYNTRSKDDKSYNHLVITDEEFPRVLVVRSKDLTEDARSYKYTFGPFPSGQLFKEALKLIRKLFQFYDIDGNIVQTSNKALRGKIDFNRQIGLYPKNITKAEYARTIRHIRLFFEGKKLKIIMDLERQMMRYARREEFEKAHYLKKRIYALKHIQDISLIKESSRTHKDDRRARIEAYDVAHLGGTHMVGAFTVVVGNEAQPSEYKKFIIKSCEGSNDPKALTEILTRRLTHAEWSYPELIVVDGGVAQKNAAEHVLAKMMLTIPVVGVVKDEHHKPKKIIGAQKLATFYKNAILLANAEAHRFALTFHKKRRAKALR